MGFWASLSRTRPAVERQEALRRGLRVVAMERDVPIFTRANRLVRIERMQCVGYALARTSPADSESWAFLQRDNVTGAQYPNGWLLRSSDGAPSARLHALLTTIARDWNEEFLEIEANREEVVAFWEEQGGVRMVERIDRWLRALDRCAADA